MPLRLDADKLVLRIRAGNPAATNQMVTIRSHLPAGVSSNHVISTGGLDIGYDVRSDIYYVHGQMMFAPGEIRIFDVEIRDIWVIAVDEIDALRAQAAEMAGMLSGNEFAERAETLQREVNHRLDAIKEEQQRYSIAAGARPIDHIRAYEANRQQLVQVKRDVARLENLVLGTGRDPGRLMGEIPAALMADPRPADTSVLHTAVIRITARNSSPTETRTFPVRRVLPAEISVSDVIDSGDMEIGIDAASGLVYVERRNVELAPGESVSFEVKLLDRWNIHGPRIERLRDTAQDLRHRISTREQFASVQNALDAALSDLDRLSAEEGPVRLDEQYVAFYREQGQRLNQIEQRIMRIQDAMRPVESTQRFGFNVKAPTMKTTWIIIYIILGFLALMSLLFFLRWYGRSAEDALLRHDGGHHSGGEGNEDGQGGAQADDRE